MWARKVSRSTTAAAQPRVGERLAPLAERRVGGDRDRGPLVALGQHQEQELGPPSVEVQVPELGEAQQVEPPIPPDDLGQLPLVLGLDELVDERRCRHVADPETPLTSGDPEPDQEINWISKMGLLELQQPLEGLAVVGERCDMSLDTEQPPSARSAGRP